MNIGHSGNPYRPPQTRGATPPRPSADDGDPMAITMGWFALVLIAALLIGAASRTIRPLVPGPVHYEAIGEMMFKAALSIAMLLRVWNMPLLKRLLAYGAGQLCLWGGAITGWSFVHRQIWDDAVKVAVVGWAIATVVGWACLMIPARRRTGPERKTGPVHFGSEKRQD